MLWVYGDYKYFYFSSAGIEFSRQQILTTKIHTRTVKIKNISTVRGSTLAVRI